MSPQGSRITAKQTASGGRRNRCGFVEGLFTRAFCLRCHRPNSLQLRPLKSKERGHLDNLLLANEIRWVSAELFNSRIEFPAAHALRNRERQPASTGLRIMQAKLTNDHLSS